MAMAVEVGCGAAKAAKNALERRGWIDLNRRGRATGDGSKVAFPLTIPGAEALVGILEDEEQCGRIFGSCGARIVSLELPENPRRGLAPRARMEREVVALLRDRGIDESLIEELPTKWKSLGDPVWKIVADCIGACRVARQAPVAATGTRDSRVEMLLGDTGWVEHRENSILYCFDATKCMFSSGNVTERSRMGQLNCEDAVVVDLFAGIGYFVLPFLVRSRAKHVYACEWNLQALYALRWNLRANAVEDRCTVIEGDNRLTAPQGVADRVCLGLLPSSEGSWAVAVRALRPEGGVLHVHENVKDIDEEKWIDYLVKSLETHSSAQGRNYKIRVAHIEHVKWYAPHIRHLVADVYCEKKPV